MVTPTALRPGPQSCLVCCLVIALATLACKQLSGDDPRASSTSAPTATAVVPPTPALAPQGPALGAGPGSAPSSDADLFAGAPSAEVKFMQVVSLRQNGVFIKAPVGWGGYAEHYDGLVQMFPKDESAVVMVNLGLGPKVGAATVELWTKSVGGRDVSYSAPEASKLGKDSLVAEMARGTGKLNKKEAEFWRLTVPINKETTMLVIAAVQKEAAAARRAELVACMRSLYKV